MQPVVFDLIPIAVVVGCSSWFGYELVLALYPGISSRLRTLGFAIMLGGPSLSLMSLVCTFAGISKWFAFGAIALLSLQLAIRRHKQQEVERVLLRQEISGFWASISIAILLLNVFSLRTVLIAICLLIPQILQQRSSLGFRALRISSFACLTLAGSGILFLLMQRSPDLVQPFGEAHFYESLSWSISTFGPDSHPGYIGGTLRSYHYLAYLWGGTISYFSFSPPYLVLSVVLPWLIGFSASAILFTQNRLLASSGKLPILTAIVAVSLVREFPDVQSVDFGNWAMLGYLALSLDFFISDGRDRQTQLRGRPEWMLGLVGTVAVLGKVTLLPLVVAIAIGSALATYRSRNGSIHGRLVSSFPWHLCGVVGTWFLWFGQSVISASGVNQSQSLVAQVQKLGLSQGLWGAPDLIRYFPIFLLLGFMFFWVKGGQVSRPWYWLTHVTLIVVVLSAIAALQIPILRVREYLVSSTIVVAVMAILLYKFSSFASDSIKVESRTAIIGVFSAMAVFVVYEFAIPGAPLDRMYVRYPTGVSRWIPRLTEFADLMLLFLVGALLILVTRRIDLKRVSMMTKGKTAASIAMALAFAIAFGSYRISSRLIDYAPRAQTRLDSDTLAVGEYLRTATPADAVIASNQFCCYEGDWLDSVVANIRLLPGPLISDGYGGSDYSLVAVSNRQFLLAGPDFVVNAFEVTGDSSFEQITEALEWSVTYAMTRDLAIAHRLNAVGADFFVVDKSSITGRRAPSFGGPVLYENNRYVVLKL